MDKPISWRVIYDDGKTVEWEQPIIVDGVEKPASIDDINRSIVGQLVTIDGNRKVIHSFIIPKKERGYKLIIWRHFAGITADGQRITIGAISGYNDIFLGLHLDIIQPDGKVTEYNDKIDLHPREVFSEQEKSTIEERQSQRTAFNLADTPLTEEKIILTEKYANSI